MRNERGFALIVALWLLVALSVVGLQLSLRARERRLVTANVAEAARARAASEAGLDVARHRLERRLRDSGPIGTGAGSEVVVDPWESLAGLAPDSLPLDEAYGRVTLRDAGAALHLNRATEDELRRLMIALRIDAGRADQVAQAILDWRDPDDLHRARGAERPDYLRRGSAVYPRNGPFPQFSELQYVKGMTPETFERVLPYLTLRGSGQVNLNTAPRPVLLALPGITEDAVAVLERRQREGRRLASLQDLAPELPFTAREHLLAEMPRLMARAATETREVEIHSEGRTPGGRMRVRVEALLVRAGTTTYLVWRQAR